MDADEEGTAIAQVNGSILKITTETDEGGKKKKHLWTYAESKAAPAMPAIPTPPKAASPLVGQWACQSRKSNGAVFASNYLFTADGMFAYVDSESKMNGSYRPNGPNAMIVMDEVTLAGRASRSTMQLEAVFTSAQPGQLNFNTNFTRLGMVITNSCVTLAVAAATPAPRVNVCDINPAACQAIQQNNDIRQQMRNQRCEILRSQLAGMVGGDYQLAKAGCQ